MNNTEYLSLKINQPRIVKADQVFVESGIVWLTQSGRPDDVLLFAGQSFRRQRSGKLVIQALSEDTKIGLQSNRLFPGVRRLILALSNAARSIPKFGLCQRNDKVGGTIQ